MPSEIPEIQLENNFLLKKEETSNENVEPLLEYSFMVIKDQVEGEEADYGIIADPQKMVEVFYEQRPDGTVDPRFFWGVKETEDEKGIFSLCVVPIKIEIGKMIDKSCGKIIHLEREIIFKEWALNREFTDYLSKTKLLEQKNDEKKSEYTLQQESRVAFVEGLRNTYSYKWFDPHFVVEEVTKYMKIAEAVIKEGRTDGMSWLYDVDRQLRRVMSRNKKLNEAKMKGLLRFRRFNDTEISRIEYDLRKTEVERHQEWKLNWTGEKSNNLEENTLNFSEEEIQRLFSFLREAIQSFE